MITKYIKIIITIFGFNSFVYSQCIPVFIEPQNTVQIDASYYSFPLGAVVIKGEYGIWYKTNLTRTDPNANRITKPFLICEGFDPTSSNDLKSLYLGINPIYQNPNPNPENFNCPSLNVNFLDYLRSEGFDIIILNLLTNVIEIEKNARLFQSLKYS